MLAVTITTLTACGGDDGPEVPPGAVAVVGDAVITESELRRATAVLRRIQDNPGEATQRLPVEIPERAGDKRALETQALSLLLYATAIEQEAAERGITVAMADARERWRRLVALQYPTRKARQRFLGGLSEDDIAAQLRIQMLAAKVQSQIASEAGGGRRAAVALIRFRERFRQRWRDRTACRADLDVAGCQAP